MNTKKLVLTSLFVALAIVLPQALHLIGGPGLGAVLLPMHLPIFIGAMLLGQRIKLCHGIHGCRSQQGICLPGNIRDSCAP